MAQGSGFFKGEKKKKKKSEQSQTFGISPVFKPPSILPKGKNKY